MAVDSKEYWRKREESQKALYISEEEKYTRIINGYYDYMLDRIQKEINGFYAKYAKSEGLTLSEAKKKVAQVDIEAYGRKAKRYVRDKTFTEEANAEMRLYNATMKINRLEMLKAEIGLELVDGHDELQKYFEQVLTDRTLAEFKRQAGILGNTVQNNAEAAHAIVNASFHNAKFSDRIWMYQDMLKAEISKLLQEGLIQGRNPRQLAVHLEKLFGVRKSDAVRLMQTELARVQTEAQKQSFERNGYDEYMFHALDSACDVCKELDGRTFKVKDMMPGTNAPPMHPRCRCSTSANMDREEFEQWLDGRARMSENEESKAKPAYNHTVVDKKMIDSADYRKKFNSISDNPDVSRSAWKVSKEILQHRSGTKYEDLAYIDSNTGKYVINKDYNAENMAKPNRPMMKMLDEAEPYTIIGVHNHPGSSVPSLPDLVVCMNRKYAYGVVVCHDGLIYKYSVSAEKFDGLNARFALERMSKEGYTDDVKGMLYDAGVELEVL